MTRKTAIQAVVAALAYPVAKIVAQEKASSLSAINELSKLIPHSLTVSFDQITEINIRLEGKTHTITGKEIAEALSAEPTKIDWIGHPFVSDNDRYTPSQGWLSGVQIGLRPDGVVVWREAKR